MDMDMGIYKHIRDAVLDATLVHASMIGGRSEFLRAARLCKLSQHEAFDRADWLTMQSMSYINAVACIVAEMFNDGMTADTSDDIEMYEKEKNTGYGYMA